ncbi:MAG: FAD-dependent thymidylate synthase, partial [Nanoarchaeota archaeon]
MSLDINIIASTKLGYVLPKEEALKLGAKLAGVCYTERDFEEISNEPIKQTLNRQGIVLNNDHHSVFDHPHYTLEIKGLPKILAMFLNNEKYYVTSEKSARYTQMSQIEPRQKSKYDKWNDVIKQKIADTYPFIDEKKRGKLAKENARYMTSVFTPTKMGHTLSFRQINYAMHWFNNFIENTPDSSFNTEVKKAMRQFNNELADLYVEKIDPDIKIRNLSMITNRNDFKEFFDETYSTNYKISFAGFAQSQRHRTLNYQMEHPEKALDRTSKPEELFFVPPILRDEPYLVEEWLKDADELKDDFLQSIMVQTNEKGTYENFISKSVERLCGNAQWEIMDET